jgi:lipopolysaccharide/colanic/teichoic acid biosynthesis glycosyltransferase
MIPEHSIKRQQGMQWTKSGKWRFVARERTYRWAKRVMDLSVCLLSAPLTLPLIAIIAVIIVLDSPGPVLFHQWRTGKNGRRFRMHKFRTMVANAEARKAEYAHLNELAWPDFKVRNDPRITRVGRILRRTSLDELPQLLNVWKGEMSLVGPRPTSFTPEAYRLWHTARLDVPPGMTGLSQVSGRSQLHFDQRVKLDLAYIERASLWLDIYILLRTVAYMFVGDGAC